MAQERNTKSLPPPQLQTPFLSSPKVLSDFFTTQPEKKKIFFNTSLPFFPVHLALSLLLRVQSRGIPAFMKLFPAEGDVFPICFKVQLGELILSNHPTQVSIC